MRESESESEFESDDPGAPSTGAGRVDALARLLRTLDDLTALNERSAAIADFAVTALGADLAGVSLRPSRGTTSRLATSHAELTRLDSIDGEEGRAPGPGAAQQEQEAVSITDTRSDKRWPEWSAVAAREGVLAVCLVPLTRLGRRVVTLELYSRTAGAFDDDVLAGLRATATIIGVAVGQMERTLNLEKALGTRDLIGQAQGMLMERYGLGSDQAMELMRRISQDSHEKIQQIARQLVQGLDPLPPDQVPAPGPDAEESP